MKLKKGKFLPILRVLGLFVAGLVVALVVALSQINLESIRGNVLSILRDATGMPIEIDGAVSWKFSIRPRIELNKVRVANAEWAKNKNAFSADKIEVRLNLISLLRDRPTIQNVKVYNARVNVEKNPNGLYSIEMLNKKDAVGEEKKIVAPARYPFKDAGLGGVEIKNLAANVLGRQYALAGFNIRLTPARDGREYSGWLKLDKDVLPFIVHFDEYNAERKVYPMHVAMATGGDALIANIALEGTSKTPIDFIIRGEVPDLSAFGRFIGVDLSEIPSLSIDVAGGLDRKKITLRKSVVSVKGTNIVVHGDWDWKKSGGVLNADISADVIDLPRLFPGWYSGTDNRKGHKKNAFKDIPLFGEYLYGRNIDLHIDIDSLLVYRDMNIQDVDVKLKLRDNRMRIDVDTVFAGGDIVGGIDADVEQDGNIILQSAVQGEDIYIGQLLKDIHVNDFISDLPMNFDFYVRAKGKDLSQIMQTITGPVQVYSVAPGYAHSTLVSYMYGTDFLTSLRHNIQDLFRSEKKHDQIKISCVVVNVMLRDGVAETQNGVAVETNAINMRLAGDLDLGREKMHLALTTVPVRGLKLSLTSNVVNSMELSGSLAEPDIAISGAAVAGKVASATGLGLLLAPFTGGIGLVAGAGIGLVAGDLLENWLADNSPCETAMKRGAPLYRDDPEWMGGSLQDLMDGVLVNR